MTTDAEGSAHPVTGTRNPATVKCPPCARDEHGDCQISRMGMLQAFCQCECREDAELLGELRDMAARVDPPPVVRARPGTVER